ncbi:uncharacterized protein BO97DRAFT_443024 [Aspergillus homomorphus CBS 101889]|uniref:Uncharacterized protein n=1 Tax=Aspergillus homomorphus (strain CBS 101889) TaxID=1450537 RepID=A0A395I0X9_ASPHC|nr:hypothetical protein BO97DRAFT_443024 [Aspergillus homomorphus CBS 101889]RAL12808.1 hypothetical protein BO97DRAFT_443024 [Aspergillus homomorphus CBS 101889]
MPPLKIQLPEGGNLVYSTIDGHDIKLDYYLPRNPTSVHLPAIIYYHGGDSAAGAAVFGDSGGFNLERCRTRCEELERVYYDYS